MNNLNFLSDYLAATLRLSVPLGFAALGGLYSERSGVLNIALEGMLLTGAFTSAAATFYTGNPWLGILASGIAGGLVGLLHAVLCVTLRAVGESPKAALTAGISVQIVRYIAVVISGCLASLGGAYLTLVQVRFFAEGMSAGKGFIAIAALIFGRWHPVGSALACLLFGATEALQLRIQALGANIPYQFLVMLPYAIALLALVGKLGKSTRTKANGTPYFGENLHSD